MDCVLGYCEIHKHYTYVAIWNNLTGIWENKSPCFSQYRLFPLSYTRTIGTSCHNGVFRNTQIMKLRLACYSTADCFQIWTHKLHCFSLEAVLQCILSILVYSHSSNLSARVSQVTILFRTDVLDGWFVLAELSLFLFLTTQFCCHGYAIALRFSSHYSHTATVG